MSSSLSTNLHIQIVCNLEVIEPINDLYLQNFKNPTLVSIQENKYRGQGQNLEILSVSNKKYHKFNS